MLLLSEIALNIVQSLDALSVKSYDELANLLQIILDRNPDNSYVYINAFECIAQALFLTITRPTLRPDDKARFSA